ncbi:hypothetical protein DM860_000657 [Cuscuta australis]|uniref:RanBD1 domain-containing protein n=1 Tax=Cuscuta australis TaxID=267555 RepID=A0A328D275_9ASTE|nr:hypothetical protein DM860_000657 [Cuscuta australis]
MASSAEPTLQKKDEEEEDSTENQPAEDEDTGAPVAPIVRLQEVAVTTGEEDEDVLLDLKAKLYRFDNGGNQWKERGVGTVKLLKHKENGKVRLVMRQSKTLKICANHLVLSTMTLQEHAGNEKSCVWHAADFADGELKQETFCIRFPSIENCKTFKDKIGEIAEAQQRKVDDKDTASELIDKLSVESKEDKPEDKGASATSAEAQQKKVEDSEEANSVSKLIEKLSVESKEEEDKPEDKGASATSVEVKKGSD